MEKLEYKIVIDAPAKKVWETMLNKGTYEQWVSKSWPDSTYDGKWEKGEKIKFAGPDGSGTLAEILEAKPYSKILARHIAVLQPGGKEDSTSDMAKGWVGIMEGYQFEEHSGKTTVNVLIETNPEWSKMFDDGWPTALEELKRLSERKLASV